MFNCNSSRPRKPSASASPANCTTAWAKTFPSSKTRPNCCCSGTNCRRMPGRRSEPSATRPPPPSPKSAAFHRTCTRINWIIWACQAHWTRWSKVPATPAPLPSARDSSPWTTYLTRSSGQPLPNRSGRHQQYPEILRGQKFPRDTRTGLAGGTADH